MQEEKFPGLDRDSYKKVKSMNRERMEQFLADVYEMGRASAPDCAMDYGELRMVLSQIKGIGDKRLDVIMRTIESYIVKGTLYVPDEEEVK